MANIITILHFYGACSNSALSYYYPENVGKWWYATRVSIHESTTINIPFTHITLFSNPVIHFNLLNNHHFSCLYGYILIFDLRQNHHYLIYYHSVYASWLFLSCANAKILAIQHYGKPH